MAAIPIFFLLLTLTISTTIHARDSQFFAKVSNNPQESQPLNTNQQNPNVIPESQVDGGAYGLYGHGSGQLPPSATTTTKNNNFPSNLPANLPENYNPVAYTTPIHNTQELPEDFEEPQTYNGVSGTYNSEQEQEFAGNNGEDTYTNGGDTYNTQKQGLSDTRFLENGKYYDIGNNEQYNPQKQGFEDTRFLETEDGGYGYNSEKQGTAKYSTSNNANTYNPEKQGMSDTRFLENGKYFYDLNSENSYANSNVNSRNGYNTNGYNGNYNDNSYDRYNYNGGYQNQEEFQNQNDRFNYNP